MKRFLSKRYMARSKHITLKQCLWGVACLMPLILIGWPAQWRLDLVARIGGLPGSASARVEAPTNFAGNQHREIMPENAQGSKSPRPASLTPDSRKGSWPAYGADNRASKYSPLDQINKRNVNQLRIAWRWESPDSEILKQHSDLRPGEFQVTPIMIGGVLYASTAMSQVVAIDARTGKTIWRFDPETWRVKRPNTKGFQTRGVAWWSAGQQARIFMAAGDSRLIALDAKTGKKILSFGEDGEINLRKVGLSRPVEGPSELYGNSSPPIICRDVVVVGGYISDRATQRPMPPGDVRGFDVRTGKLLWTFHTIPQPGEFGNETWENDSWKHNGNTNVWAPMSADDELGYVYLPVSTPTGNFSGKERPGNGLFGESLVCVEAKTGKRVWSFQLVHHGVWDYDLPAAPNLVDITVDGRRIKAVAQVTKQGFCYVFDRVTGKPVWPIEERPVPQSKVPGEKTSPTQPFPTRPPAFERQGVTIDDLIDFTPELRAEAIGILKKFEYGPLFTPPGENPTILMPGAVGGANWNGAAVDPETGWLYVPSVTAPLVYPPRDPANATEMVGPVRLLRGRQGLPLFKPPYGRITAIDLNRGEIAWQVANGDGPRNHPAIKHLNLGPLGSMGRPGPLLTRTLLFVGEGPPHGVADASPIFRAYDKATGKVVWEFKLDQHVVGAPMTYLAGGKQYIVVSCGFRKTPHELIAFSLP